VAVQRSHDADPGEHGRPAKLGKKKQRFHRGLPLLTLLGYRLKNVKFH
jgi:hypothetical protein